MLRRVLRLLEMLGKPVPDFSLASLAGTTFKLYDFRDLHAPFARAGAELYGISKQKIRFPFELLLDPHEAVWERFGVMKEKWKYGKKVRGTPKPDARGRGPRSRPGGIELC